MKTSSAPHLHVLIQQPAPNCVWPFAKFDSVHCEVQLEPALELGGPWHIIKSIRQIGPVSPASELPILHGGFFDSHLHVRWLGEMKSALDFSQCQSLADFADQLTAHLGRRTHSELVQGYGWDEEKLHVTIQELAHFFETYVDPSRPVLLSRVCGHSALASRRLREQFGLAARPEAAHLTDRELFAVYAELPKPTAARVREQMILAQNSLLARGVSAVGDMSLDESTAGAWQDLAASGDLKLDVVGVADAGKVAKVEESGPIVAQSPVNSVYLQRAALLQIAYSKKYLDGSFGSRTAWLSRPYADADTVGQSLCEFEKLRATASHALGRGLSLSFHAIGDAAVDQALALGDALGDRFLQIARRPRIEHAQLIRDDQLAALARQRWVVHSQPGHRVADAHFAEARLGPSRLATEAYRLANFLRHDIAFVLGSDAPIDLFAPEHILGVSCHRLAKTERLRFADSVWSLTVKPRLIEQITLPNLAPGTYAILTPKPRL